MDQNNVTEELVCGKDCLFNVLLCRFTEYFLFKQIFFELLSHLGHHITTGSFHQIWAIGLTLRSC